MFEKDQEYRRRDIHNLYGGQEQGGISTPSKHKVIFLFTGEKGKDHGYSDGWQNTEKFFYTGEGQIGDMTFSRGNKAIRDHLADGKDIHVFEQTSKGYVRYLGQMICTAFHHKQAPDTVGKMRQAIVFELQPV